ncbi:MAG: hypothetical protein ACM31O_07295 [Bacteroidota bacterium]|jgi:hypothetical protein
MWTGRETLASIERAIADLNAEEGQLDVSLRSAVSEAERLRKERGEALRELARVKLDEIAAGRLVSDLDAGERRAAQVLDDYRLRIAAAAERRVLLLKELASAEVARHHTAQEVEKALEAVEALRAEAEARVQKTPDWVAANNALQEADAIATAAETKAAASVAKLGAKKKPYDDDPLFIYLWRRRFGTREYAAGPIARVLDRKVADFIGFQDARANYAALIEIPLRLKEHAAAKRGLAGARKAALSEIERRAMVSAGVDAKEQVLARARHELAAADEAAESKRAELKKIDDERAVLMSNGSNPAYDEALTTIASADSKDDLATLYREARRTASGADEAIVKRVETVDAAIAKVDAEIAGLRRSAHELARRKLEVEQVRDRFRGAGYDHPHTTFGNDVDIADVLKGIVIGAIRSGVLWDLLRQGYGSRPPRGRPDFGAPNFPFPFPIPGGGSIGSAGGGWRREPESRGGWSPTADPSSSGESRDDDDRFTTGGAF